MTEKHKLQVFISSTFADLRRSNPSTMNPVSADVLEWRIGLPPCTQL